jgi:hypothetical protein
MTIAISDDPAGWFNAKAHEHDWKSRLCNELVFDKAELNNLHQLWSSLTPDDTLPAREQLTARLMKPYMRNLSIFAIERDAANTMHYRHRFFGTAMADVFGNLTGKTFDDFLPPALVKRANACFDAIVCAQRPLRLVTRYQVEQANHLSAEIFAAPLAKPGEAPNMVMTVGYFLLPDAWKPAHALINAALS